MKIVVKSGKIETAGTEAVICGVWEGEKPGGFLLMVDRALKGLITEMIRNREFEGKTDQMAALHTRPVLPAGRVVLVGLGKKGEWNVERVRQAMGRGVSRVREMGLRECVASTRLMGGEGGLSKAVTAQGMVEGALLGHYRFTKYRVKEKNNTKAVAQLTLMEEGSDLAAVKEGVRRGEAIAGGVYLARDLVNHPANDMTPTHLAEAAVQVAAGTEIRCRVLSRKEIERVGMGAFLGVARGSEEPLKFIILEYQGGKKGEKPVVLVGKSITFDSGGISLKPSEGMEKMKYDMAGGAATLGAFQAAVRLRLPVNLVGLLPATENLPSGTATKPGDILRSLSGWTIEVVNTDAEGRLVLADALTYALRYQPAAIVDIATLTGACVVALGSHAIGILGNDKKLKERILRAGEETGERAWEMPLWDEYHEQIKSSVADLKNTGGREAGMITAGAFLSKFVNGHPWVHLDIAGAAWKDKETPYIPKGAVGVGVRLLVQFLTDWSGGKKGKG
ncbi:MAG: leucyl aminopeptidase [Nitrospirae bacterium]|nr:leucyl aminopeptidase [Nitrospirota bacterium]